MWCMHVACTLVFGAHTETREGHLISPLLSVFYLSDSLPLRREAPV